MDQKQFDAIKEEYSNMDWEDFRENAGDLITREIEIYNTVVIEGVPALIAEVKRLQKEKEALEFHLKVSVNHAEELDDELEAEVDENERLREALQTIASHNIFTTPQIEIKDFAGKVLAGESND